jgi:hypothetical protein
MYAFLMLELIDMSLNNGLDYDVNDKFSVTVNSFLNSSANNYFNKETYFKHYSKDIKAYYFQLIRKSDSKVYATFSFYENEKKSLYSPLYGTFGGVSAQEDINFELLELFISSLIKKILSTYNHIVIKLNPLAYNQRVCSKSINILTRIGFQFSSVDLNYSFDVNSSIQYNEFLSNGNKKKLKQCLRDGLFVKQLELEDYSKAYDVILINRTSKNYTISVTRDQFEGMVNSFGKDILCFGVYSPNSKNLIASSICIRVSEEVLYVFYWGDVPSESTHSPIIILSSYLYDFCLKNNFKVLDIGTSTINGQPISGLVRFKENIGFKESLKFSLEYIK